jgi:hypothetical protein
VDRVLASFVSVCAQKRLFVRCSATRLSGGGGGEQPPCRRGGACASERMCDRTRARRRRFAGAAFLRQEAGKREG